MHCALHHWDWVLVLPAAFRGRSQDVKLSSRPVEAEDGRTELRCQTSSTLRDNETAQKWGTWDFAQPVGGWGVGGGVHNNMSISSKVLELCWQMIYVNTQCVVCVFVYMCVCVLTRVLFIWLNSGVLECLLTCSRRLTTAAKSWRQMAMYTDSGLWLLPGSPLSASSLSCGMCLLRYPKRSDVTVAITEWQYCSGETCSNCI